MKFWDSSALVPLLVRQAATGRVTRLLRDDGAVVAWWAARVECESAIARLERGGQLVTAQGKRARTRLDALASSWAEVHPGDALRDIARHLLRRHDLRAADALQLAAALMAAEQRPSLHVALPPGLEIKAYIASSPALQTEIKTGKTHSSPNAPTMASFSSRGAPRLAQDLIKPDITAPGVQILAGASPVHYFPAEPQGELFVA